MLTNFIFYNKEKKKIIKKEDQRLTLPEDRVSITPSLDALTYDE